MAPHVLLLLLLLALLPLSSESQGARAGLSHLQRSRGLHLSLGGPTVVRRNSNFQAMLETFGRRARAAATEVVPAGGAVEQASERELRSRPRKPKRVSKRQLEKELMECRASLEACQEEQASFMFIQMAESCTLRKEGNRTIFSTTDMDVDTYGFYDRPYRYDANYRTTFFNDFLFDYLFAGSPAVAALTFNVADGDAEATFEGPLVSVLLQATSLQQQADNITFLIEYEIVLPAEEEAGMFLSSLFPGDNLDGSDVLSYEHCTLFIDSARDAFQVNAQPEGNSAFFAPRNNLVQVVQKMQRAATAVQAGPPAAPNNPPWLLNYAKVSVFPSPVVVCIYVPMEFRRLCIYVPMEFRRHEILSVVCINRYPPTSTKNK